MSFRYAFKEFGHPLGHSFELNESRAMAKFWRRVRNITTEAASVHELLTGQSERHVVSFTRSADFRR